MSERNEINLPIDVVIMSFIRQQAELARRSVGSDDAGILDAQRDNAYAQLTRAEIDKTNRALSKLLKTHAGKRRLAAVLSIAVKAAMGDA